MPLAKKRRMLETSALLLAMVIVAACPNSASKNAETPIIVATDPTPSPTANPAQTSATSAAACPRGTPPPKTPMHYHRKEHVLITILRGGVGPVFNRTLTLKVTEVLNGEVTGTILSKARGSCILGPATAGACYEFQGYTVQVDKVANDRATFIVDSTQSKPRRVR
jgi:hypothetical protein